MTEHHFETPEPVQLYVEIGNGQVRVTATETTETPVVITGRHADEVEVEQLDRRDRVVVPPPSAYRLPRRRRRASTSWSPCPTGSDLSIRTGSADVSADGTRRVSARSRPAPATPSTRSSPSS